MSQETAASGTTPVPQQRTNEPEPAADRPPVAASVGPARPLALGKLLSVATLTPAQASLVAVQLLDAARLDPGDGELPVACLGPVTLTPTGDVEVGPAPSGGGTPLPVLLGQLLENARRLPLHPRPDQLVLLRRLEEAADEPLLAPGGRARGLEEALARTLGPDARQRLTRQLAALVDAFAHVAPGVPAVPDTRAAPAPTGSRASRHGSRHDSSGPGPQRAAPARPPSRHPPRRRALLRHRTRGRVALLAVVLAAVLAVSGYVVLGGPGSTIVGSLGRDDQPAAPDTTAPDQPTGQPAKDANPKKDRADAVASIAPRQAGPITGVTVQKTGTCSPGALCPVTVTVHFRPESTARTIGWKVGAARVCTRGITWSPPVTVTAQPGWTTVYASSSVRVPKGRSLALVALTTTPDRAQSRPVPVTASSQRC